MLGVLALEKRMFLIITQPSPDVPQTGEITKAEMSIQAHRWHLLFTVLAD